MQSSVERAASYRRQAAELGEIAARQPEGSMLREQLETVAAQYEQLARQAESERY